MRDKSAYSRRRFLRIAGLACVGSAGLSPLVACLAGDSSVSGWGWRGVVLGAEASIQLYGLPEGTAARLTRECFLRIRQLEGLFSLYDPASTLCRLNREGCLNEPPADFIRLLRTSLRFARATEGAFDITIQPLWECYRDHYSKTPAPSGPPCASALRRALSQVDYRKLLISEQRITFAQPGMSLSLNGIAQGYITDRIVEYLREEGVRSTLVNLGEYRALGEHPEKRPWQLGIRAPGELKDVVDVVSLENAALAVSGGYGHVFEPNGRSHHLLHPRTGQNQPTERTVAVVAPTATEADALSTAGAVVDDDQARSFMRCGEVSLKVYG